MSGEDRQRLGFFRMSNIRLWRIICEDYSFGWARISVGWVISSACWNPLFEGLDVCFGNISKVGLKLGWVIFSSVNFVCYCFSGDLLLGTSPIVWSRFFGDSRFLHCGRFRGFCR